MIPLPWFYFNLCDCKAVPVKQGQAIFLSVCKAQALVYIYEAYAEAFGLYAAVNQFFQQVVRKDGSVVGHFDIGIVSVPVGPDSNGAYIRHFLHGMSDRIFHQRLDNQLWQPEFQQIRIRLQSVLKLFFKACLLDGQIAGYEIKFPLQGYHFVGVGQGCPEEIA